ncbi:MAG TPA: hypothetical protein VNN07_13810 [Candidatus Tectomicrobia bacterium]|nr:hypothetical protein [Candidatus Tectomicrobia bacterium]
MTGKGIYRNERGVALPLAMIALGLLTSLMLAFAVLAQSEPMIAANHLRVSQARALAESGFERAVWALSQGRMNPGCAGCIDSPLPAPVPQPYDGSQFVAVGNTGGYVVTVTPGPLPNERNIRAVGWTPTDDAADTRTKAHRIIEATVEALPDFGGDAPCALCVKGALDVGGNATIDGTQDTSCGSKKASITVGATDRGGSSELRGADGNSTPNESTDYSYNVDPSSFDGITFTSAQMKTLRELAKKNGTYFGPGYPNGSPSLVPYLGAVTFNSSNKLKDGIVFIDTISGTDLTADSLITDMANVSIHGNPFVSGTFTGWIIVNGSINISGNMQINGMVYAMNDIVYNGTGTGRISGIAVSQNVKDISSTTIDSDLTGQSKIIFNCEHARGGGKAPGGFLLKPGTYREIAG